jgi:nucleoside-diphosphate kinase
MEKTLVLLKPDTIRKGICGDALQRFEKAGYKILGCKMMQLDEALLKEHYSHLLELPFFPEIQEFMQSTPVIALALAKENAVVDMRDLLGPTDSTKAPKGTLRGDLGETVMLNVAHASDSEENAAIELQRFFKSEEIFDY